MSVGFQVWSIVPRYVSALYRLHGQDSRERMLAALVPRLSPLADDFETEIANGQVPSPAEALNHIMDGEYPEGVDGAMYAYVLESATDLWGQWLPNSAVNPCGSAFVETVDAALQVMGVDAFRLSMLSSGTLPCPIPSVADFPGFGHLTPEQCRAAKAQLDKATYQGDDPQVGSALNDIKTWLRKATKNKTTGLIGFFH